MTIRKSFGGSWTAALLAAACGAATLLPFVDAERRLAAEDSKNATPTTPGDKTPGDQGVKEKSAKYVRIVRDARRQPLSLDTAIVRFTADENRAPKGRAAGAQIDLIGAVHVGEPAYYEQLNKRFEKYDAVLYELVAPEGTRIPAGGRAKGDSHPVSMMQSGMKSMLGLEHQLDRIDYTRPNLIHADMTPEEFARSMKDRNESFTQLLFRMLGQGMARQAQEAGRASDMQVFGALFAKDRNVQLKRAMAEQFEDLEGAIGVIEGDDGSTLITERNRKALSVLERELAAGKKRIAIFYGAGHLPDLERRLVDDFGMRNRQTEWIPAWSLRAAPEAPAAATPRTP